MVELPGVDRIRENVAEGVVEGGNPAMPPRLAVPSSMLGAAYRPTPSFVRRLGLDLANYKHEALFRIDLDERLGVIGLAAVAEGTAAAVPAKASAIFRGALIAGAASVALVHNHPSRSKAPSAQDHALTKRIRLCGELLRLPLYDHLIVAGDDLYSFRSAGVL